MSLMGKRKKNTVPDEVEHKLVGAVIQSIGQMSDADFKARGWHERPALITFQKLNGKGKGKMTLYASADPEGNDGGIIFGTDRQGDFILEGKPQEGLSGIFVLSTGPMSQRQIDGLSWYARPGGEPTVINLSDGSHLFVSTDHEGNGPGVWVLNSSEGEELL